MANIQVITRERHAQQRWTKVPNYKFAATEAICHLSVQEMTKAMLSLPIGFVAREGGYSPVAMLGLSPAKNLFVAMDGRWVGGYIPAVYRAYPFVLAKAEDGQRILCINEDSGLLTADTKGERFFTETGEPAEIIQQVLDFLIELDNNRAATQRICDVLQKHNLIQPWAIKVQDGDTEKNVAGLFRLDEAALNQLPADALAEVRDAGGLLLAYCQLLSMQHLTMLGQLAYAHAQADAQLAVALPTKGKDLDLSFMNDGETFKFS